MTINELQDNVIEEFSVFDDWMDKYALLIDLGNSLPPLDEKYKTESNLIEGCQSRVWFQADYVDGKIIFQGESDAVIVKGIVSLLIQILSGHTPRRNLGCGSILYRQGRIKRAFIPYPFQRVGSDGEANASVRDGLPGKRNNNKNRCFHMYIGTSRYVYTCKPTPI